MQPGEPDAATTLVLISIEAILKITGFCHCTCDLVVEQ